MSTLTSRVVHCVNLGDDDESALVQSMIALNVQLERHYPTVPPFSVDVLDPDLHEGVHAHLAQNMPGKFIDDSAQHPKLITKRLLVLCPEDHPFVEEARSENPRANWGIAVPCRFSVAWVDNEYLWWHESLHLFNAKDCYNKFGIHKCPEARCVMQSSPTHEACGGQLHLCSKNVRRLSTNASQALGE